MTPTLLNVLLIGDTKVSDSKKISHIDQRHLKIIRLNVLKFTKYCAQKYDKPGILLDIAPQIYEGAKAFFKKAKIETLDIDPNANATYTADICQNNSAIIPDNHFDFVLCTEVLEHTLNPFYAVAEIHRILKPGGFLFLSTPFNFRIHGPLPDCWRFTEHGLRELLKNYKIIELKQIETKNRWLMPIHYTAIAKKLYRTRF